VNNYQLRLRLLRCEARLAALEVARSKRPKREAAPRPTDGVCAARQRLWHRFLLLQVGHGPTTKLAFCVKHRLGHPSDFGRFLSTAAKRGIPEGSTPALRYYAALQKAVGELERTRVVHGQHFHGIVVDSQAVSMRPQ
jgi:hypothetical protein